MKIMQIIPSLGFGGAEIMCENLVYELKRMSNEIVVVSLYNKRTDIVKRLEKSGVRIIYLNKKAGFDPVMFFELLNVFRKEQPDVIHTHIDAAKYVFPIATLLKMKVVHTVHNVATKEAGALTRRFYKLFYKYFKVTPVALSEKVKKSIVYEYKLDEVNVPIVFNGIDLSKCIEKTTYSTSGNFIILHIGRFSEQKNHIGLLSAFKMFHSQVADSELWLVGDGEKRDEIENNIRDNNLSESVKLFGAQNNVYGFLHDADIFTLPSNYEGMPMTLIEAMGTGLPIVATAVGGVPDMLSEDVAQLVSVDEEEISEAFKKYYNDFDLRKSHGDAVKVLSENFSVEIMAKKYLELYLK